MEIVRSTLRLLRNSTRRKYFLRLLRDSTQRKYIFRWLESLENDYFLKNMQPWLVFDAIDFLNSLPLEGKRVFEYGSGGSTLYWLSRKMICVSVEHDPGWYETVRTHLDTSMEVDYRLVQPEKSSSEISLDISDPRLFLSDHRSFRGYSFKNYVNQIDAFPDDYFDVVLIDGRARPSCIMLSVSKVKVNGLLILDNADCPYYTAKTYEYLRNYRCSSFYGTGPAAKKMWGTNFYVREE